MAHQDPAESPATDGKKVAAINPVTGSQQPDLLERADLLRAQIRRECLAMSAYALTSGKSIPPDTADQLKALEDQFGAVPLSDLAKLHADLAGLVAPALPGSIAHVYQHAARAKFQHRLAPVPVARWMALVGLCFVISFLGIGLFPEINGANLNQDILQSSGWTLLLVQLFLLSAAGAGACFGNLFEILKAVNNLTILPTFSSEYWVKLALGIIAGLLLAELIPLMEMASEMADGQPPAVSNSFQKPVVALLGGFSASILYTILNRLTETLENLFAPSGR